MQTGKQFGLPCRDLCRRKTIETAEKSDILLHGQVGVEGNFLRHVSDTCADLTRLRANVKARHSYLAFPWRGQDAEQDNGRRVPRPIRTEKPEDLAAPYFKGVLVNCRERAKTASDIIG